MADARIAAVLRMSRPRIIELGAKVGVALVAHGADCRIRLGSLRQVVVGADHEQAGAAGIMIELGVEGAVDHGQCRCHCVVGADPVVIQLVGHSRCGSVRRRNVFVAGKHSRLIYRISAAHDQILGSRVDIDVAAIGIADHVIDAL